MFKSFLIAISTYSRIPTPKVTFEEKDMKYTMCFFPCVGVIIGGLYILLYWLCQVFSINSCTSALLLSILPILITGGIHLDGYMDTCDALSSYAPRERKLEILKDPHCGAFAVIGVVVYIILYIAASIELCSELSRGAHISIGGVSISIIFIGLSFVMSRALSGLSVVTFRKAKKDGMLAGMADATSVRVKWILIITIVIIAVLECSLDWRYAAMQCVLGAICYVYYRYKMYKEFGGISGDMAGFFLQIFELVCLIGVTALERII